MPADVRPRWWPKRVLSLDSSVPFLFTDSQGFRDPPIEVKVGRRTSSVPASYRFFSPVTHAAPVVAQSSPPPARAAAMPPKKQPAAAPSGPQSDELGDAEDPLSQEGEERVLLQSQHSGTGFAATAFEPERHSVMVLGRPVQASPPSAASGCCDGCYLLPDSLSSTPSPQASPCCTEPFTVQCCVLVSGSGIRYVSSCGAQSLSPRAQPS